MSEEPNQRDRAQRVGGLCKRVVTVTGHRIQREREANEEMKGLMDSERGEFSRWKSQKETENRGRATE